jgi:hypothetical protein
MQAIRDHELCSAFFGGVDDGLAFGFGRGHGLFEQNVNPGLEGPHGVLGVQIVGECEVNGVDLT